MGTSFNEMNSPAGRVGKLAAELQQVKAELMAYRQDLQGAWKGEETAGIFQAVDAAVRDVDRLIRTMDTLKADVSAAVRNMMA